MRNRAVVVLAGGTGSVKLARGIASLENIDLTVISNVADNIWLHGLQICPDIDTVLYGLSGMLDSLRGWGVKGDTFQCLSRMEALGASTWFTLGDKDLAMHITRTEMLQSGMSLTDVTDYLRRAHFVKARILPASDDRIETVVTSNDGPMHLQEFWVKNRGRPAVRSIQYDGIDSARATKQVTGAIANASVILISPGNPVSSIGPIVGIEEIRKALLKRKPRVVAVSPLVGSRAFSGPAVKYMKARGMKPSVEGIADFYSEIAGTIAISEKDSKLEQVIRQKGLKTIRTEILMKDKKDEIRLAKILLEEDSA